MKHCTNDPTLLRIIVRLNLKVCMLYTFIIFRDHFLTFFTSFLCSLELCICNSQFLSFLSFVLLIVHRLCGIIFYTLITRKHYLKRVKRLSPVSVILHLTESPYKSQEHFYFLTCVNTPSLEYLDDLISF